MVSNIDTPFVVLLIAELKAYTEPDGWQTKPGWRLMRMFGNSQVRKGTLSPLRVVGAIKSEPAILDALKGTHVDEFLSA